MFGRGSAMGLVTLAAIGGLLVSGGVSSAVADVHMDHVAIRTASSSYDAFAWGSNSYGQLGLGTSGATDDSVAAAVVAGANSAATWDTITAGYTVACGLGSTGLAYCWGNNAEGALGNGTTTSGDDSVPGAVLGGLSWVALSAGSNSIEARDSVCGIATTGDAYCWGDNTYGQLGNGTTNDDSVPHLVDGGLAWSAISAGGQHVCGITSTASAYCWGSNHDGQLGDGTGVDSYTPVLVSGGRQWKAISVGQGWTCAITIQDQAYCWGYNGDGQLGNGTTLTTADDSAPAPVVSNQNTSGGWQRLDAGYGSTCAIGLDDVAYCWGRNYYGQLGDGTTDDTSVPVRALIPGNEPVMQVGVATDWEFACAATPTTYYCWGQGGSSVLGNPTAADPQLTPLEVSPTSQSGSLEPKALAVGGSFSLILVGPPNPAPPPPAPRYFPPTAPRDVTATAADKSATVAWVEPDWTGSFSISDYQVTSNPGSHTCLAVAPALTCEVTGLTNGTAYTFTVKARNAAGWSTESAPSAGVVPQAAEKPTIVITGVREGARILVAGTSASLGMGGLVTPWVSKEAGVFLPGRAVLVSMDGTFTWSRKARLRSTWRVYMAAGDLVSNTVTFGREPS